ncbi:MAG: hypothetical protein K9N49_04020 [Candidatus Marinimicrobia bacterium]|nr:hypothetical protein [Candidatus Neomarinimicrobiota bacterium]
MRRTTYMVMGLVLLGGAFGASVAARDEAGTKLTGFTVPQYGKEDNRIVSRLFGDLAEFMPGGFVRITNMRADFYSLTGAVEMQISSPLCRYDEGRKRVESEDRVRIVRSNIEVTGRGFEWDNERERLQINNDARVVLQGARDRVETGGLP